MDSLFRCSSGELHSDIVQVFPDVFRVWVRLGTLVKQVERLARVFPFSVRVVERRPGGSGDSGYRDHVFFPRPKTLASNAKLD
jgi:hypothetical protein